MNTSQNGPLVINTQGLSKSFGDVHILTFVCNGFSSMKPLSIENNSI